MNSIVPTEVVLPLQLKNLAFSLATLLMCCEGDGKIYESH